ncbi:MAG: integrase core domain-containing protein [Patescibacteria group bacterium]
MTSASTLQSNFVKIVRMRISEYEQVKAKTHPRFRFASDFYKAHKLTRQNFIKYYNRFKSMNTDDSLMPQKRGRKYGTLKTYPYIQSKILELRNQGFGKYDIYDIMYPRYGSLTPSITTIYNILKRYGVNKPSEYIARQKRRYVKDRLGELGHIDCHYIQKGTVEESPQRHYLLTLVDDHSRLSWSMRLDNIKSITVSYGVMSLLSLFKSTYGITFKRLLSDNGPEFKSKETQYVLSKLNIKSSFTKPYRPQTNGKVERFWRSLEDELLRETVYIDVYSFEEELFSYCVYYNHLRKHYGLGRQTPYHKLLSVNNKEDITNLSPN